MTPEAELETCLVPVAGTEVEAVREPFTTWYDNDPAGALSDAVTVEGALTVATLGDTVTEAPAK